MQKSLSSQSQPKRGVADSLTAGTGRFVTRRDGIFKFGSIVVKTRQGGMDLAQSQIRVLAGDFFGTPTMSHVVQGDLYDLDPGSPDPCHAGFIDGDVFGKGCYCHKFKISRIVMRPSGNAVRFFDSGFFIPKLFFFDKVPASLMLESQEPASGAFRVPTNAPVVSELAREFKKKFAPAGAIGPPLGIPVAFSPGLKIRRQILANPAQGIVKFPGGIPIFRTWECFILHDIQRPEGPFSSALLARPAPSAKVRPHPPPAS
jgi:hypothetical protein